MADTPPWLEYQRGARPVTVPLGPPDPYKSAAEARANRAEARAERADQRAAQAAAREQAKFEQEDTMAPPPGDTSKTGDAYLATLSPSLAAQVKALSDGRRAFPTGTALRSPAVQQLIAAATQYDPTLDAANAATRVATRKKFTSGTTRDNITAINTALGHLGTLYKDSNALDNRGIPIWNSIANAAESATGDPRVSNFNMTKHAVVDELEKAFRGSGGTQAGIEEWSKAINSSQSPKQFHGAIGKAVELLNSRLEALNDAYSQGMGHSADPMTFLNPHARAVFNALGPGGDGNVPDLPKDFGGAPPILGEGGGGSPPSGPSGNPLADPSLTPATGATKTEIEPRTPVDKKIAAMLASGAPSANIRAYAKANGYNRSNLEGVLAWRALNPQYNGPYDVHQERIVPTTLANRMAASPAAAAAMSAGDALTLGLGDEAIGAVKALKNGGSVADNIAAADFAKQSLAAANPNATLAGNVLGGTAAMIGGGAGLKALLGAGAKGGVARNFLAWAARNPIKTAALGDTAYGTAYGAGENNDNRLLGAGIGALVAPIASVAGSGVARGVSAAARGVADPAVQRLRTLGIPLTTGEVLGGGWKKAQDAMTSVFGPGNMVARRYNEGRRALNEAAFNEAGNIVDTPINAVGQQGVDLLDAAKSQAYSDALDPVTLNMNDPKFIAAKNAALATAGNIPNVDQAQDLATGAIRNYVGGAIDPATGAMAGRDFQQAYRGLARTANKASDRVYGHEVGDSLGQAKDALVAALQEQAPGAYEGFVKANAANRHLNILAKAVEAAKNQVSDNGEMLFTPAQLGTAATANARKFSGDIAAARGARPFNQLAADAQQVMSSRLPESGTAPRWLMTSLATGGLTAPAAAVGYGADGGSGAAEGGIGTLGALTLLGTRRGQQALTAALANRTAQQRAVADFIRRFPTLGSHPLTSLGVFLADSPTP